MNYIAIGDIHGSKQQLEKLLGKLPSGDGYTLIFLGDYVDVGPDSKGVLSMLIALRQQGVRCHFLAGNHEFELLRFLQTGDFVRYAKRGGLPTIRSYCGRVVGSVQDALARSMPSEHLAFLEALEDYHETPDFLFSHAGYDPAKPHDRSHESMVMKSHPDLLAGGCPLKKTVICGHYFQHNGKPFIQKGLMALDTGCGILGGPLSAAILPAGIVLQVSPQAAA